MKRELRVQELLEAQLINIIIMTILSAVTGHLLSIPITN